MSTDADFLPPQQYLFPSRMRVQYECIYIICISIYTHIYIYTSIFTSIAARGGGGSFKRLKLYNSEEHLPIEPFVDTLIH